MSAHEQEAAPGVDRSSLPHPVDLASASTDRWHESEPGKSRGIKVGGRKQEAAPERLSAEWHARMSESTAGLLEECYRPIPSEENNRLCARAEEQRSLVRHLRRLAEVEAELRRLREHALDNEECQGACVDCDRLIFMDDAHSGNEAGDLFCSACSRKFAERLVTKEARDGE